MALWSTEPEAVKQQEKTDCRLQKEPPEGKCVEASFAAIQLEWALPQIDPCFEAIKEKCLSKAFLVWWFL